MASETHRDMANELIEALGYSHDDRVRAVFLVGSSASGETDQYSDIDLMVSASSLIRPESFDNRLSHPLPDGICPPGRTTG